MTPLSEWLQLMLAEIERKREEQREQHDAPAAPNGAPADAELARRAPSP